MKRSKNIEDKNEELLKEIKNQRKKLGNKDSKTAKVKIILIYDQNHNHVKQCIKWVWQNWLKIKKSLWKRA